MDLFIDRLKELILFPISLILVALFFGLLLSPFFIIDYFFEGWGSGILVALLVFALVCSFINWIIIEPFFKNK